MQQQFREPAVSQGLRQWFAVDLAAARQPLNPSIPDQGVDQIGMARVLLFDQAGERDEVIGVGPITGGVIDGHVILA